MFRPERGERPRARRQRGGRSCDRPIWFTRSARSPPPVSSLLMLTNEARHYIGGAWIGSDSVFDSTNPARQSEVLGTVHRGSAKEVDAAVAAAREAYRTWREESWVSRAEFIDTFAQLVKRDIEEIAALVTRECGKPLNEGRADAVEALHMAQYVAGMGRMPNGFTVSSEIPAKDAFILRKSKGVIACITPWNFPSAIPLWVILPAILAGNTVVFKPAEQTPLCGHKLMELFHEAGFPKGVINLVQGFGEEVGEPMVRHAHVEAI
ncbi:MAG: hypothetical protein C4320_04130, partial [Armatimonadota bacterium]